MADKYFFPADATTWASFTDKVLFVPRGTSNAEIVETFTIPTTLVYQGPAPLEGTLPVVTVGGAARTVTETTPSAGQVQIDRATGEWTFNAADSGGTASVTMTPYVTWVSGEFLERLQDLTTKPSSTDNAIARFSGTAGDLQDSGVTIDDSDNITTTGDIEAADGLFTGSGGVTATGGDIVTQRDGVAAIIKAETYGQVAVFNMWRANDTLASPTTLGSGNEIGRLQIVGYDGSAWRVGARVTTTATENWTGSARGCKIEFQGTSTGTTTLETKFETTNAGIKAKSVLEIGAPIAAASVPTPATTGGFAIFSDASNGNALSVKDSTGTVSTIDLT